MSGLSHFAIQTQPWIFKTQSKFNPSPKLLWNLKLQVQIKSKKLTKYSFSLTKLHNYFPSTQFKTSPDPKFWSILQSGSNPKSTKFAIDRIQSNPSPVQCSSLAWPSNKNRLGQGGPWLRAWRATLRFEEKFQGAKRGIPIRLGDWFAVSADLMYAVVATSLVALRWLCDSPWTGCAWRITPSVYLGTTINKQQIMPQKTNHIRTAFILFPGHLKQPYGFLVRCPDK